MTDEPRIHVTDGPYSVTGAVPLVWLERDGGGGWVEGEPIDVGESYVLCRCGGSATKPFFDEGGSCGEVPVVPVLVPRPVSWDMPASSPVIAIKPNGPLRVRGVGLSGADGTVFVDADRYSLCRCGRSNTMPFCDGSHKEVGFRG
jgi:CDGSH-type Zn-finger protein